MAAPNASPVVHQTSRYIHQIWRHSLQRSIYGYTGMTQTIVEVGHEHRPQQVFSTSRELCQTLGLALAGTVCVLTSCVVGR